MINMASLLFFVFDRIINEISIIKPVTTKNNCNQFKNQVSFNWLCEILARNKIMHFKKFNNKTRTVWKDDTTIKNQVKFLLSNKVRYKFIRNKLCKSLIFQYKPLVRPSLNNITERGSKIVLKNYNSFTRLN